MPIEMRMCIEFNSIIYDLMSNLLTLYQMNDWGCSWEEFLTFFGEQMEDKIKDWQKEKIGEEE